MPATAHSDARDATIFEQRLTEAGRAIAVPS
jgi:hypothetical protein